MIESDQPMPHEVRSRYSDSEESLPARAKEIFGDFVLKALDHSIIFYGIRKKIK